MKDFSFLKVEEGEDSKRVYPETEHAYRNPFERDRDRIVHSKAFKRLEFKTQVFIHSVGENFRTRLTHTLEVSGIARTIAKTLGLNETVAETIALAHDLGHSPFGHSGQDILAELMHKYGGFEHNKQSLRIVQILENQYPAFPGLNLTYATLSGIMKHGGSYSDSIFERYLKEKGPSLEALIADKSDGIAYNSHDLEDGLEKRILKLEECLEVSLFQKFYSSVKSEYKSANPTAIRRFSIRKILDHLVTDLLEETTKNLEKATAIGQNPKNLLTKVEGKRGLVENSEPVQMQLVELKNFLHEKLYKHPEVLKESEFGKKILEKLFFHLLENPTLVSEQYREREKTDGLHRVVCDFVAGMTDRYAKDLYEDWGL